MFTFVSTSETSASLTSEIAEEKGSATILEWEGERALSTGVLGSLESVTEEEVVVEEVDKKKETRKKLDAEAPEEMREGSTTVEAEESEETTVCELVVEATEFDSHVFEADESRGKDDKIGNEDNNGIEDKIDDLLGGVIVGVDGEIDALGSKGIVGGVVGTIAADGVDGVVGADAVDVVDGVVSGCISGVVIVDTNDVVVVVVVAVVVDIEESLETSAVTNFFFSLTFRRFVDALGDLPVFEILLSFGMFKLDEVEMLGETEVIALVVATIDCVARALVGVLVVLGSDKKEVDSNAAEGNDGDRAEADSEEDEAEADSNGDEDDNEDEQYDKDCDGDGVANDDGDDEKEDIDEKADEAIELLEFEVVKIVVLVNTS